MISEVMPQLPTKSVYKKKRKFVIKQEEEGEGEGGEIKDVVKEVVDLAERSILGHLGDYVEEPHAIIESYFEGHHLERLVRHQIESYNNFVNYQIQRTIQMFNPVLIRSENDYVADKDKYFLEVSVKFSNFKLYPPQIHENNGATKTMFPKEAKLRSFTYASTMTVDIHITYTVRNTENMDNPKIVEKVLPKINIGKLPIMLKSSLCMLVQNKSIHPQYTGECAMDCGGYFIIKGSEKTVLGQERAAENKIYCFDGKNTTKWSWYAEIKSVPDFKCISPKQTEMMISSKNNGFGHGLYITIPRIKQPIELFVLFRALGIISDKDICKYIVLDIDNPDQAYLLQFLQASMIDANKYMTQEDALRHITAYAAYTPMNMEKEVGARKKREFTVDVLDTDLFPHCQTLQQKLYLVGYMATKLIQTSLGLLSPSDRDSYVNKRIELTGTLLNNLFRNYFNKLVKEMQKQVVREINTGSWRSKEDYENIINMTNIYKIMKSTTIENGLNRALATGDFSIKQSNSSKVGVAQVLNRLTYVASLSHLRRVNTPLEKSGELIPPRKLHNTTWGFLCPAETPEGQSIGIVKNISYMGHITIPTNSSSLYEYVQPHILSINDASAEKLYGKVKVFVNGAWVGIAAKPVELYSDLKTKKYRGMINIYTSIVFDYKQMEIRVCNDGGRLTRPLLLVRDNKALITQDIIHRLTAKELSWNDLLTNCKLDESVVEYIDPEEQSLAMIAMKTKSGYLQEQERQAGHEFKFRYTHCEIHPSTIFGVLASCIPYPEHNQSPRNTYQCLGPNELVWMSNGMRKRICDIQIGEKVLSFHPETLDITETTVVNHFVRPNDHPIYKLRTVSGREIIATLDHKFMTNEGWKTVGEMQSNITDYKIGLVGATKMSLDTIVTNEDIQAFKEMEQAKTQSEITIEEKNNCLFVPIESITEEPDGLISDIEVESENHSFIAGSNFLSSNCAMAKQAMGVYATNYDQRMDKTAYVLNYPSRPLVDTRLMNFIKLNRIPSGTQIHVAIMTHTGYNQEDSVLINKGSIDRGLFLATIYHTEKDEDKNIIRDEIIRCKPDPTKTKGIKFGNYDKLTPQGFIPENSLVENRDVIIAKIIPIKENRNDPTKTVKFEDQSKTFRTTEETYIDKNFTGRNGDGYNFAKVRVRTFRKPVLGDKFSSRHGQKGTIGNIIEEADMPFTKNGLRPDIIINPHAIPSRMTIGQLKETLLGKVLLELGLFGDGTSFGNLDAKTITRELQRMGYEGCGNELMYNGLTGEQLETNIYIGPVFYQRLKHMVNDKQHSRSIGPMVNLTRQPAEGRSRDGGFRIGEMERDVMLAHGMSRFCRERLYDVSDKYSVHVCRKCGMVASYNDGDKNRMYANADFSIHHCKTCSNTTDFAKVDIPYAYKLMAQELQTINVVPRIITE
uniref:DNA-directed RNA polymerase n=1 Tax=viral metagenome TaxID=1070528 RepID=A0A6C0I3R8_9ZZZZ